ncbi:hypothetical protein A2U01_0097147, partial [Trifolium medium]|nr:hypothetical protein [Trifolium medium]
MGEVVVHRSHPTVDVLDSVYVEHPGRFFDTWAGHDFLDYGYVSAFFFVLANLDRMSAR